MLSLKILGCHSPYCLKEQACPSYLLNDGANKILLDCGSGSHRFFDMNNLNGLNIFISHLHKDHFNDIFNYLYSSMVLKNQGKIKEKIKIYLPEYNSDLATIIKNEQNAYASFYEINENINYKIGDFNISFCKLDHSHQVEMYAIKLKIKNKTIIYSGDVSYSCKKELINFAKNADIFICESSLLKEHNFPKICAHLTSAQAAEISKEANVKLLLLTHLWPDEDISKYLNEAKKVFKNVMLCEEGKEILL